MSRTRAGRLVDAVDEEDRRRPGRLDRVQVGRGEHRRRRVRADADHRGVGGEQRVGRDVQELDRARGVDRLPGLAEMGEARDPELARRRRRLRLALEAAHPVDQRRLAGVRGAEDRNRSRHGIFPLLSVLVAAIIGRTRGGFPAPRAVGRSPLDPAEVWSIDRAIGSGGSDERAQADPVHRRVGQGGAARGALPGRPGPPGGERRPRAAQASGRRQPDRRHHRPRPGVRRDDQLRQLRRAASREPACRGSTPWCISRRSRGS